MVLARVSELLEPGSLLLLISTLQGMEQGQGEWHGVEIETLCWV